MFSDTALRAALLVGSFSLSSAFECTVISREDTTNFGPGIPDGDHAALTPFPVGEYNAVIAFDEEHCIKMCCEELKCYVAVFDHTEAVCYLKGANSLYTYEFKDQKGFTTHEMFFREGDPETIELEPTECKNKKGVAFDFQDADDLDALAPGMSWWYNWSPAMFAPGIATAQATSGTEYIPMIWGEKDIAETSRLGNLGKLDGASHLLGFNEPNFGSQANLTPAEAAKLWSTVKSQASALGADIVSPAVNFCGGDCTETDPIKWLDEFFAECEGLPGGCGVTAIGVHSYTCEAKWLNKILYGYMKYNLPIWLTEFACAEEPGKMNEAAQASFLKDSIKLLEMHPAVERYAWFTGRGGGDMGVRGADLLAGTGELTQVGSVFVKDYADLQKCGDMTSSSIVAPTAAGSAPVIAVPGETAGEADVDPAADEITNVVIGNLGGSGTYKEVMSMAPGANMQCSNKAAACVQEDVSVSGSLSPFDEGVSVAFRGPMNIHNIVWFEGERDSLTKTSAWTPTSSDNLVFLNNQGGSNGCSGEWTICGGNSQSYSDETGSFCADKPTQFKGVLGSDEAVNIMTASECKDEASCGFFRDTAMEGWKGGADGTKVMVFEVDMPHCGTKGFNNCEWNRPAVWALNSKVVRTAQYGCNCRGMGGNGGCGEFDIVEAVIGNDYSDMMFTTVYDFKGTASPGTNKFFRRPSAPTHYAAIFRGGTDAYLQVVQLEDFDYTQTALSGDVLDSLRMDSTENHDIYDVPA